MRAFVVTVDGNVSEREKQIIQATISAYHASMIYMSIAATKKPEPSPAGLESAMELAIRFGRRHFPDLKIDAHYDERDESSEPN